MLFYYHLKNLLCNSNSNSIKDNNKDNNKDNKEYNKEYNFNDYLFCILYRSLMYSMVGSRGLSSVSFLYTHKKV